MPVRDPKFTHVAVLMGGWSAEREVSLSTGEGCADALRRAGFRVTPIDVKRNIAEVLADLRPDVAFNALAWHSLPGEYGGILGLDHDALGIPSERDYLARYYAQVPVVGVVQPFHFAFAMFRFSVIFEGIAARAAADPTSQDNYAFRIQFANGAVHYIRGPVGGPNHPGGGNEAFAVNEYTIGVN